MRAIFCVVLSILATQLLDPAEISEKPVALYKGLGSWHHSISTQSPEAQKFFDQGRLGHCRLSE